MTSQELIALVKDGAIIVCETTLQRKNVLELFDNWGLKIGRVSREYLEIDVALDQDTSFMNPGFNAQSMEFVCYRIVPKGRTPVQYADIADVVENSCVPKIDERSETEFAEDFASLMR